MAHSKAIETGTTCPNCQTYFERVPVERDEQGSYAVLEVTPCHECGQMLCGCCSQVKCDACGQTVCSDHVQVIEELKCCTACYAEIAAQELESIHCPACLSTALRGHQVTMEEPGYSDHEYRFTCQACGAVGAESELLRAVRAEVIRMPTPKPVQRETRIAATATAGAEAA